MLRVLTFDTALDQAQLDLAASKIFTNPVTELGSFGPLAAQVLPGFDWALWVGFKPGVRDNEGATAIEAMTDALGREFGPDEAVLFQPVISAQGPAPQRRRRRGRLRRTAGQPHHPALALHPGRRMGPNRGHRHHHPQGATAPRAGHPAHRGGLRRRADGACPTSAACS